MIQMKQTNEQRTINRLDTLLRSSNGRIMRVNFIKRTTGKLRVMSCRLKVRSKLNGGSKPYIDKDKGLLTVYDMGVHGYRSIPLDGIQEIKIDKVVYQIKG